MSAIRLWGIADMMLTEKTRNTWRKTCRIATLFDTGPLWIESSPPRRQAS
jgi:hypothetical protein